MLGDAAQQAQITSEVPISPASPNPLNSIRLVSQRLTVIEILTLVPLSHLAIVKPLLMSEIQLPIRGMLDYREPLQV